jgi:diacylglycerol kinase family enzyme
MYFYILDPRNVPQKDFERQHTELQSLLTEHRISGELARVTPLRPVQDLVDIAAAKGAKTLVACGTDETFHQMLAATKQRDFTLAFVPFTPKSQLGGILGLESIAQCVKVIAGRRIERLDAAVVNGSYFISYLELGVGKEVGHDLGALSLFKLFGTSPVELKMRIDDSYTVTSKAMGALVMNTRGTVVNDGTVIGNPQDGFLDLLLVEKLGKVAILRNKKAILSGHYESIPGSTSIRCKKVEFLEPLGSRIYIDGTELAKVPTSVEIVPGKLRMIVGKNRAF